MTLPTEPRPNGRESEAEFLARQSRDAQSAIVQTLGTLAGDLKELVDIRAWAKQFPLATVASAAVAGFVLARGLNSRKADHGDRQSQPQTERRSPVDQPATAGSKDGPLAEGIDEALKSFISPILQIATAAALTAVEEAFTRSTSPSPEPNAGENGSARSD